MDDSFNYLEKREMGDNKSTNMLIINKDTIIKVLTKASPSSPSRKYAAPVTCTHSTRTENKRGIR